MSRGSGVAKVSPTPSSNSSADLMGYSVQIWALTRELTELGESDKFFWGGQRGDYFGFDVYKLACFLCPVSFSSTVFLNFLILICERKLSLVFMV